MSDPTTTGSAPSDAEALAAVFKAYDVRGVVPEQLDERLAEAIGAGFGRFVLDAAVESGEPPVTRVLVARDMRPSGVALVEAFGAGVRSQGLDVVDLGLGSTDLLYFAAGSLDAPGAMFTASHNPAQYNGAKFCLSGARPVGEDTGLARIREFAADRLAGRLPDDAAAGGVSAQDVLGAFADHVRSFVDVAALRPLKVVADTANGMGGLVVPAVFDGLPFDLEVMYGELDGTFPNHPADPIQPENQADLRERVLEVGADIGLAFDGDADRVFLVDEQGQGLSGSTTTAIIAAGILDRHPGETVIHNLICSRTVPEVVRERGGTPVRTRVGHSFIKQVMAETGAIFGGEHSAHYYFRDNYRADSGLIAALVVLEQLSRTGLPLSELRRPFERYAASGEINTRVDDPAAVIEGVAAHYASLPQDRVDGLTVDGGDWWFNLRPSNTEPLLRLNLEAPDEAACAARVAEVRSAMGA
jgi:phosphomannomutase